MGTREVLIVDTREVLNRFLDENFNGVDFTEEELLFLESYSIKKDVQKPNDFLKKLNLNEGYDEFRKKNDEKVDKVIVALRQLYDRFKPKLKKEPNAFGGYFENFLDWYLRQKNKNGKYCCCYCGIDEDTTRAVFDRENGILSSEKRSFSGSLQIERLDPEGGYNSKNCKLACVLCNNAKSDMIDKDDFEKYIAYAFRDYWEKIKKELKK